MSELIPYEKNPRKNDSAVEMVARSIKEFGFKQPIVIDENNVIVAGHTRLEALKKLGEETADCVLADDLTPEQIKAYRLADNKVAEYSHWNYELLTSELDDIDLDMEQFGFLENSITDDMLDEMFVDAEPKEKEPKKIQCPHCGEWFEV